MSVFKKISRKLSSSSKDVKDEVSSPKVMSYGALATSDNVEKEEPNSIQGVYSKTQNSFIDDLFSFAERSVPQSIVVAIVIGVVCGISAFVYYRILWGLLQYVWHTLPNKFIVDQWDSDYYALWIPIVGFLMAAGVGLSVKYVGEPGDLPYTIKCVHEDGYIDILHMIPMVLASQFSIIGGGSLGPEAPLVAICACLGGFISMRLFKRKNRNTVRKHTLMGMAGALAAFFGSPLGGSLFALEVNNRFGIEYFEHAVESIFCGEVTLAVFRGLAGLPIAPIWDIKAPTLDGATPDHVLIGTCLGLLGAGAAALFANFHWTLMGWLKKNDLLRNERAVPRAFIGAIGIVSIGLVFPQTMFWGEYEFPTIVNMKDASSLVHIWPTAGLFGFEMRDAFTAFLVGVFKLIAISFTVAGGYRGGFIFPFFATGAAFGRAINAIFPFVPIPLACLGMAAGINTAITRTSLATPVILCFLGGQQNAMTGVLTASLVSLFATSYMPFMKSQVPRNDIDIAMFFNPNNEPQVVEHDDHGAQSAEEEKSKLTVV